MSAKSKWTTFKLHYNITNTDEAKIIQNNELNILICLKYAFSSSSSNPTYELLTLNTDIGTQEVEVPIKSIAGQFPAAEFCLVGYHILKWQSLITNLSDATLADYAESSSSLDKERLVNDYVKNNSEITWTPVGKEGDDPEEASIDDQPIYNNYITVTGDFLGENVNPLTKISRWSLGNMANRWKNIYSNKVICDYTYCDAILPQENYIKNSQYLRATWSLYGSGTFADPVNFVDQKITDPDTIFEAWEVSSGIYSIKINNNTYYLKLADFNVSSTPNKMVFNLYTDIACTTVASGVPNLERFNCPNMWRYSVVHGGWVTTENEDECQYKEIKIGTRSAYSGINLFYCYPSDNEDQRIYCECIKTGMDVTLATPLEIHNKEVTTADFFIPNVVYISQTKAISTVGTEAKPYEQAHIKKVCLGHIPYSAEGGAQLSRDIITIGIAEPLPYKTPIIVYGTNSIPMGDQSVKINLKNKFPFLSNKDITVVNATATWKGHGSSGDQQRMLYITWGGASLLSCEILISSDTTGFMDVAWNAIVEIKGDLDE